VRSVRVWPCAIAQTGTVVGHRSAALQSVQLQLRVLPQLGRTRRLTNERQDFFQREAVLKQVAAALRRLRADDVDYITFVGQGEPLLCASLGWLIRAAKSLTSLPVAVITNGALLSDSDVRIEVLPADVVIPTVDAADRALFGRINRPHTSLRLESLLQGLRDFRQEYSGLLWIEVMLVAGLNDDDGHLARLGESLRSLSPDAIQINVPIRPPAEPWVKVPGEDRIEAALAAFGDKAQVVAPYLGKVNFAGGGDLGDSILDIIQRHPIPERDLYEALGGYGLQQVAVTLERLQDEGQAHRREHLGHAFWTYSGDRAA
jgi:wyosine [tRNA(Phe)-imidazoG37] synthetase (radical SAM superfamily)